MSSFRFTNAYRAADRVSQYLIREVQYRSDRSQAPNEVFFRTMLFKIFNKIETWEAIEAVTGPISWEYWSQRAVEDALSKLSAEGARIYSAAYIMPSPAFGYERKHLNHLALLESMMRDGLPARLAGASGLKDAYHQLLAYPSLGPFLAFQYAIDLNYSTLTHFEESEFVVAGPGALDGISKCFVSTGGLSPEAIIGQMVDQQESEFERLGIEFKSLFGRRLQPIDCQNLFCEISKYARVAHTDITGISGRTRIKQKFHPEPRILQAPFFPPKWGLWENI
jgi:alpha-glutamyl/putrescinyl thymine pyrophosphorylase clade 1